MTFFIRAQDPDAAWFWGVSRDFGDPGGMVAIDGASYTAHDEPDYCAAQKFGPWTPPPRASGDETLGNRPERGETHTYMEAGTYTARFSFRSDSTACGLHEPYGSKGDASVAVVVRPAGSTSTSAAAAN